jgi:uncharacterized protein
MRHALRAVLAGVLALPALAGCAQASGPAAVPPALTARGVGTVSSRPDVLTVVLGVQTRGRGARDALDENSRLAGATIEALRGAGVAEPDLRTSQLSVFPTTDPTTGRITGYEVSNLVTATLRDVERAGAVIDAAGAAAGDAIRVQQLEFSLDDDSAARAQARADAVRRAQDQARQLAEAAGVSLGEVRSLTEVSVDQPTPEERDAAAKTAAEIPVLPGTQELRVAVEVVYDLRPAGP